MRPLRTYANVIPLEEQRRVREQQGATGEPVMLVNFVGWRATPDMLTPSEIAALRREAKETSAYARKAFAHLRLENGKVVEKVPAETAPEPSRKRAGWLRRIFRT